MINAAITVMVLRLRRDVPSLLLVFLLPPLVFFVFTAVFREASTRTPTVAIAVFDETDAGAGARLADALAAAGGVQARQERSERDLRARVATGGADVGLVIRGGPGGAPRPELIALSDQAAAVRIVAGRLAAIDAVGGAATAPPVTVIPALRGDPVVLEEIGAVAAMFLLVAAIQVAATLVDERRSGIHERVACGGDVAGLVLGKLVFGTAAGTVQAGLIVATAALAFGADVMVHPIRLAAAGALTAAMATSLTLLVGACCSTRHQAQTISTFAILISSAVGGSKVPAKLMPDGLARIGAWMPNAWSIRAFAAAFDMGTGATRAVLQPWLALAAVSVLAGWLAVVAFRRPPLL